MQPLVQNKKRLAYKHFWDVLRERTYIDICVMNQDAQGRQNLCKSINKPKNFNTCIQNVYNFL